MIGQQYRVQSRGETFYVKPGSWFIRDEKGKIFPIAPDFFALLFEPDPDEDVECPICRAEWKRKELIGCEACGARVCDDCSVCGSPDNCTYFCQPCYEDAMRDERTVSAHT